MKNRRSYILFLSTLLISLSLFIVGCASNTSESINSQALWDAEDVRNKSVVISDIHLGIEDKYTETLENRPLLIEFLQRLQNTNDVRELVIAGDFLDDWYLPVYYPKYTDVKQFYRDVMATNQGVWMS